MASTSATTTTTFLRFVVHKIVYTPPAPADSDDNSSSDGEEAGGEDTGDGRASAVQHRRETSENFRIFKAFIVPEGVGFATEYMALATFKGTLPPVDEGVRPFLIFAANVEEFRDALNNRNNYYRIASYESVAPTQLTRLGFEALVQRYLKNAPGFKNVEYVLNDRLDRFYKAVGADAYMSGNIWSIAPRKLLQMLRLEGSDEYASAAAVLERRCPALFGYYDSAPLETLTLCFPNDGAMWRHLYERDPVEFERRWHAINRNFTRYFFKTYCSEFGLTQPMRLDPSYQAWFAHRRRPGVDDNAGETRFLVSEDAIQIDRAQKLYARIKAYLKRTGATAFLEAHLREFMTLLDTDLPFLTDTTGVLVKDDLFGVAVYAPRSSALARRDLIDTVARLNVAFAVDGPLHVASTFALDARLNDAQRRALALTQLQPVVALPGEAGTGKSEVIKSLCAMYGGPEQVLVVTQCAALVDEHRRRGIESHTLRSVTHRLFPKLKYIAATAAGSAAFAEAREKMARVRVLIVDEATNNGDKDYALLLRCVPSLRHLVLVFDPNQIGPIAGGQFAKDLMTFLKAAKAPIGELTVNYRMAGSPESAQLVANDRLIMAQRANEMTLHTLALPLSAPVGPGAHHFDYAAAKGTPHAMDAMLVSLFAQGFGPDRAMPKVITLTHKDRKRVNLLIDSLKKQHASVPSKARFYVGQRLVFDKNLKRKQVVQRPKAGYSDATTNGSEFVLGSIRVLGASRAWNKEQPLYVESPVATKVKNEHVFFFAQDVGGGQWCIGGTAGIPESCLAPAWSITSNSSQGKEWDHVVVVLPKRPELLAPCFVRNHLHVMATRARKTLVFLGSMEVLEVLAMRNEQQRFTLMGDLMLQRVPDYGRNATPERIADAVQALVAHVPAAPAPATTAASSGKHKKSSTPPKSATKSTISSSSSEDEVPAGMSEAEVLFHRFNRTIDRNERRTKTPGHIEQGMYISSGSSESSSGSAASEKSSCGSWDNSVVSSEDDESASSASGEEQKRGSKRSRESSSSDNEESSEAKRPRVEASVEASEPMDVVIINREPPPPVGEVLISNE